MNLNSDAIQNVRWKKLRFESGVVKASTEGVGILSPDISYSGIVADIKVGETTALLDFLCYDNTANALKLVDADAVATMPCIAIALEVATSGNYCKVFLFGYMKVADLDFGLVTTAGTITISGDIDDGDIITLNGILYEFCVGDLTAGSDVKVDVSTGLGKAIAIAGLKAAINIQEAGKVLATDSGDIISINAVGDVARNYTLTETGDAGTSIAVVAPANGINGYILYASDTAGDFMVAASATSTEYNQIIGHALSRRELWFNPDLYSMVVP